MRIFFVQHNKMKKKMWMNENEKSHKRIIENLTILIPAHWSHPFLAWTEKIKPEPYKIWSEQKKLSLLCSIERSREANIFNLAHDCSSLRKVLKHWPKVFILSNNNANAADWIMAALNDLTSSLNFTDVASMLDSQFDHLCRELCILLRRHLTRRKRADASRRPRGLSLLLGVILKLQKIRNFNQECESRSECYKTLTVLFVIS